MNKSYKGKILISTPDVSEDIFSQSVVLIVDHNENGAFGLILNKKSNLVSNALKSIFQKEIEVFDGGPVENDKVFFILKGKPITDIYMKLENDYYITEDIQTIVNAFIDGKLDADDVKIFSGYSGWATGQLENEVEKKHWTVVDAFNLDYTNKKPNLWKNIMQNLGGEFLIWANAPKDITMN
jgi:putative transcriptional regulator